MAASTFDAVVPNFREDERVRVRYATMVQRRIAAFAVEHENGIRRNASAKRDQLGDAYAIAQSEYDRTKAIADETRDAYAAAYPHRVVKGRLHEPQVLENMRSLGVAKKLYQAAYDAWAAAERATSELRRIEHNTDQLEIELKKALERAPQTAKDVTDSDAWLAEIHAEPDLAAARAAVDAIDAERAAYAERLAAGDVSPEERRLRRFAEDDVQPVSVPLRAVMFYRLETYGSESYFILRDLDAKLFALPYDRRLETILDGVYDVVQNGTALTVRRSVRDDTRVPISVTDHFVATHPNDGIAAQTEQREHRRLVGEKRMLASATAPDDVSAAVIDAFVAFASKR